MHPIKLILGLLIGFALWIISILAVFRSLFNSPDDLTTLKAALKQSSADYVQEAERADELAASNATLQSEASHLRNLNWLLARQIEREKGGEQLNQMKP